MTLEEVLSVARLGAAQGCTEALFTLGKLFLYPSAALDSALHATIFAYQIRGNN